MTDKNLSSMKQMADYIQQIEINSLWRGKKHVVWNLNRHVNILSGVNGVGKSTILNRLAKHLTNQSSLEAGDDGVTIVFDNELSQQVRFDVIRSFDSPLISSDLLNKMTDIRLRSELDFYLYQLQRRYLDYQVNLSNRMLKLFTSGAPNAAKYAEEIGHEKEHFFDLVDRLFLSTQKKIVRDHNEILFRQHGDLVSPYLLSSGEKQMLIILLTVLVQNREPYVLLMDEPEISLHIEWQQSLIGLVLDLNPQIQIILSTHSPAVIMDGWADCVTDVEDIIIDTPESTEQSCL